MQGLALGVTAELLVLTAAALGDMLEDDVEAVEVLTTFPYAIPPPPPPRPLLEADEDRGLPFSFITHRLRDESRFLNYPRFFELLRFLGILSFYLVNEPTTFQSVMNA